MKNISKNCFIVLLIGLLGVASITAQDNRVSADPNAEIETGLDLYAVAELFKDSDNLENFEQKLNDPATGINNLDLNQNGEIDLIRVLEKTADNTHLIILQVPMGVDDFQDVAKIAVEQSKTSTYDLQIEGDPVIYGENYYVVPAASNFGTWAVLNWIFRPGYRPYISPYSFTILPRWWTVRHPVAYSVYHARTGVYVGRRNFVASKTVRVTTVAKINYHPRSSTLVVSHTRVVKTTPNAKGPTTKVTTTQTKIVKVKKH